jgi:hypothetical protein
MDADNQWRWDGRIIHLRNMKQVLAGFSRGDHFVILLVNDDKNDGCYNQNDNSRMLNVNKRIFRIF